MLENSLDHHLVAPEPAPLYMGELPRDWSEVPARVVFNLCGVYPWGEPFGRVVLALPMLDALDSDLMPSREDIERFVDVAHLYASSEPTYWHCHAGLNRSGLVVATYLHRHRGMRIGDAIERLRTARSPMVLCNSTFEGRLREWYGDPDEQDYEPFDMERWIVERTGGKTDWK